MPAPRDLPISATVRVPGTTANLGPGFDTLGIALRIHNCATATRVPGRGVTLTSPMSPEGRVAATAMLSRPPGFFFRSARVPAFGFSSTSPAGPHCPGLGSSVTARLDASALNQLSGNPLTGNNHQLVSRLVGTS